MTDGQIRVLVLILILLALEAMRSANVRSVIKSMWSGFNTALTQASQSKGS